jgi:hypothetical protein
MVKGGGVYSRRSVEASRATARAVSRSRATRPLRTCGDVSPQRVAPLAWVAQLETLEDVLHRGLAIVEVVVQDEYTHDVVAHAGELYLVFDST